MPDKIVSLYQARLAREQGAVVKDWGGKIAVALAYPNHYRIGMSNLGFQIVYKLFNEREDIVAERVFLPDSREMSLQKETAKGLLSLESQAPLKRFDIVAFSLSFENDYPNLLHILELGKIPLLSRERDHAGPLIMAGGVTSFMNPEPVAPFIDLFVLGEAETALLPFLDLFKEIRHTAESREELFKGLAKGLRFVYVPSLYRIHYHEDGTIQSMEAPDKEIRTSVQVACDTDMDKRVNTSAILTPDTEFSERLLIELGRGCGRSCRFCAAGYVYRPPRVHKTENLLDSVEKALKAHNRLGLLSATVSDTPGIEVVTETIIKRGGHFSVSSLRADSLTPALLQHLKASGQKSVAIAPEAGSERLRKVINKHLTHDQIVRAVRLIAMTKEFSLRLYFLIGLPTERQEDVSEILELIKSIKHHLIKESRTRGRIGRIKLSVNCFVPKPFTPFQWHPLENTERLKEKQKWLKKSLSKEGGVKVSFDIPKWAYVQTLLSMGDRRVGGILKLAHENDGDWKRAFRHSDLNPDFFVYRPKGLDEILPWDFIDHGIDKAFLVKEYKLALKEKESDVCHVGECDRCGVCRT